MNTPAHAILNLVCLNQDKRPKLQVAVIVGAILPDAPMIWFYFVQKVVRGLPEPQIWGEAYYQESWQNFFDVFNSLPLAGFGFLASLWAKSKLGIFMFASMMLHVAGDLPLHHDDGHRHFFPFSNWRFVSPVSYWDPDHYGGIAGSIEILAVILACGFLLWTDRSKTMRILVGLVSAVYIAYFFYVLFVWVVAFN